MSVAILYTGRFTLDGVPCKVEIFHNGVIDLDLQLQLWLMQTADWTSENFAHYVQQKNIPGLIIRTRGDFNLRK